VRAAPSNNRRCRVHNISTLNNKRKIETQASLNKKKKFTKLYAIEYE